MVDHRRGIETKKPNVLRRTLARIKFSATQYPPARVVAEEELGKEAIVPTKWVLEIYEDSRRKNTLISMHEFNDFASLRTKIVENRGRAFHVGPPDRATPDDFQSLLDLRSEGFKVERK
jgi:hypothetical protein